MSFVKPDANTIEGLFGFLTRLHNTAITYYYYFYCPQTQSMKNYWKYDLIAWCHLSRRWTYWSWCLQWSFPIRFTAFISCCLHCSLCSSTQSLSTWMGDMVMVILYVNLDGERYTGMAWYGWWWKDHHRHNNAWEDTSYNNGVTIIYEKSATCWARPALRVAAKAQAATTCKIDFEKK